MPSTTRGAFPYPAGADNWKQVRLALQALADRQAAVGSLYAQGVASARPVASAALAGTLWFSTDTGALDYCTGSAWISTRQVITNRYRRSFLMMGA